MFFKGPPNVLVKLRQTPMRKAKKFPKKVRFDKNGFYETQNEFLAKVLVRKFEQIEEIFTCQKCDFATDNKGELLSHYRRTHPKEDK